MKIKTEQVDFISILPDEEGIMFDYGIELDEEKPDVRYIVDEKGNRIVKISMAKSVETIYDENDGNDILYKLIELLESNAKWFEIQAEPSSSMAAMADAYRNVLYFIDQIKEGNL